MKIKESDGKIMDTNPYKKEKSDAQRFTELTGWCWHERDLMEPPVKLLLSALNNSRLEQQVYICKKCKAEFTYNPTYENPKDILLKMKEFCGEERYCNFINSVGFWKYTNVTGGTKIYIEENYILNPAKLLRKACEFLQQRKGE